MKILPCHVYPNILDRRWGSKLVAHFDFVRATQSRSGLQKRLLRDYPHNKVLWDYSSVSYLCITAAALRPIDEVERGCIVYLTAAIVHIISLKKRAIVLA